MVWIDDTFSDTTSRNHSRFIAVHPTQSSLVSLGIDFISTLNSSAPFYLDSAAPIYLSIDTRF